jgi:hypothetical protein
MASTRNCSERKSREHYVSEAILRRFSNLLVSGMPWQAPGEAKIYPRKALVANVLCERHNNALAPLDTLAARAFDALIAAADYAVNQPHPGRVEHHLISGHGLELWMYKLHAGTHFGGIAAADGKRLKDAYSFPTSEIVEALTNGKLSSDGGLFVSQNVGAMQSGQISIGPILEIGRSCNVGVQVQFGPIRFDTTISPRAITEAGWQRRRPGVIDFTGPARDSRVVLSWDRWGNEVNRIGVEVRPGRKHSAD